MFKKTSQSNYILLSTHIKLCRHRQTIGRAWDLNSSRGLPRKQRHNGEEGVLGSPREETDSLA